MQVSPLLDAAGFTRKIEQAFRTMWVEWCRRHDKAD
jgi:predicted O-linked N-acetylglucosamine transferase (SPINDLY family)